MTGRAYWGLLRELTMAEIRLRDQGTVLGFAWTLLHPALMFAVLYGLFIKWLGRFVEGYGAYLLVGLVMWNHFQRSSTYALGSLRRYRGLVLNYRFPRELVVFAAVAAVTWSTLLELAVLLPFLSAMGAPPTWSWLLLPVALAAQTALALGVGLVLAPLSALYQDVERIWDVASSALFYLTPVFYPLSVVAEPTRRLLLFSPLAQTLGAARGCLIEGRLPGPGAWAAAALGAVAFALGLAAMRRLEPRAADRLLG